MPLESIVTINTDKPVTSNTGIIDICVCETRCGKSILDALLKNFSNLSSTVNITSSLRLEYVIQSNPLFGTYNQLRISLNNAVLEDEVFK